MPQTKEKAAEARARNREKLNQEAREYRRANREEIAKRKSAAYQKNRPQILARVKELRAENPERQRAADARYRSKLKADPARRAARNAVDAAYQRRMRETSDLFRITNALRARVYAAVRKQYGKKAHGTMALIGCSIELLRAWLQSKWKPGMTWENYGTHWHVDHVIPVVEFDLRKEGQQLQCFHYSNLQPLWKRENLVKQDSIPAGHQPELPLSLL